MQKSRKWVDLMDSKNGSEFPTVKKMKRRLRTLNESKVEPQQTAWESAIHTDDVLFASESMTTARPSVGKHTLALSADQQTTISMILNDKSLDDTSKFMMLAEIQQRLAN